MENKKKLFKSKTSIAVALGVFLALTAITILILAPFGDTSENNLKLQIGNSPVLGEESAPVLIYQFTDFSCPFCAAAEGENIQAINMLKSRISGWEAPMPLIIENYVRKGEVKIVFKYFPGHGSASAAHAVAFGLNEQNPELFWKFAEKAFAGQSTLNLNDMTKMRSIANELGADEDKLNAYLLSRRYELQFSEDTKMARENKVEGTPIFFINGKMISGAKSFSDFEQIIEKELSR